MMYINQPCYLSIGGLQVIQKWKKRQWGCLKHIVMILSESMCMFLSLAYGNFSFPVIIVHFYSVYLSVRMVSKGDNIKLY